MTMITLAQMGQCNGCESVGKNVIFNSHLESGAAPHISISKTNVENALGFSVGYGWLFFIRGWFNYIKFRYTEAPFLNIFFP